MTPKSPLEISIMEEYTEIEREWNLHRTMNACSVCDSPKQHTEVKDFILKALSKQRQQIREEIQKLEKYQPTPIVTPYNQAIQDVLNILNTNDDE